MADVTSPFGFPYPEDTDLVRDGASDIENLAEGVNDYLDGGYLYAGTVYFTSSGSFLKADPLGGGDIGLRAIRVRMVGGGGGGGGCAASGVDESSAAGSGGGGSYSEKWITDIAGLSASETITRGSGGAGGAAGNNSGTNGGQTSAFTVTGPGGFGAVGGTASAIAAYTGGRGSGGVAGVNADVSYEGAAGDAGFVIDGGNLVGMTMNGGHSALLIGRGGSSPTSNTNGAPGSLYGGGGMGGRNRNASQSAKAGGAGANGIVIIDCFV
jgi:hypothetical protein